MVEVLETAWSEGMTSAGSKCDQKIEEVATTLGISKQRVSVWIGNKRAKEKRAENGNIVPKKKKTLTSGPNAYSYFVGTLERGSMDGAQFLKKASEEWSKMPVEEKEPFFERSRQIREDPLRGKDRDEVISIQMNRIENAINILSSHNYEVFGMGYDLKGECAPTEFGSPAGIKFADVQLQQKFRTFLTGKTFNDEEDKKKDKRKQLRSEVRKHFHKSWVAATGTERPVPYQDLKEGRSRFQVVGLPTGVTFNDPSTYGIGTLKAVLQCPVKFQLRNEVQVVDRPILENSEEKIKQKKKEKKTPASLGKMPDKTTREPVQNLEVVSPVSPEDVIREIVADPNTLETVHDLTHVSNSLENQEPPEIPKDIAENMLNDILGTRKEEPEVFALVDQIDKNENAHQNNNNKRQRKAGTENCKVKKSAKKRKSNNVKTGSPEYEIDFLVEHRNRENGQEFLVQWKGYQESDRTWEPVASLPSAALSCYWEKKFCTK